MGYIYIYIYIFKNQNMGHIMSKYFCHER